MSAEEAEAEPKKTREGAGAKELDAMNVEERRQFTQAARRPPSQLLGDVNGVGAKAAKTALGPPLLRVISVMGLAVMRVGPRNCLWMCRLPTLFMKQKVR